MSAFENLLGSSVINHKNEEISTSTLASNEVVGLYFSAHWCPPCRGFTPQLANTYKTLKEKGKKIEIIFVSSDKDQTSFDDYFHSMPWLALDFSKRDKKALLSKKFKVSGIPTLVLLNSDGSVITTGGRGSVGKDPSGDNFPWTPKTVWELLGAELKNNKGETKKVSELRAAQTVFGLYFSAHWCPPCRGFTPKFVETYKALKNQGKPFEVVFLSNDKSEGQFQEYFDLMPWLCLPFDLRQQQEELGEMFECEGIPHLVIISSEGKVINSSAVGEVGEDPQGANFPWKPKPLNELNGGTVSPVNDGPALILHTDESEKSNAEKLLLPIAQEFVPLRERGEEELIFYYATNHPIIDRIRQITTLPLTSPTLYILDIPSGCSYLHEGPFSSEGDIRAFIKSFKDGSAKKVPFKK